MEQLQEVWVIMDGSEEKNVWKIITHDFHFNPSVNGNIEAFSFKMPVDVYDISETGLIQNMETNLVQYNEELNKLIVSIFVECMENDPFMYVLDWHHSSFRYNPRIKQVKENPCFIENHGHYVYFPEFYPDGDYYFFAAKDFRWGYFTHPWQKKAFVFGDKLMEKFKAHAEELGFSITKKKQWNKKLIT